jgi:Bacterial regulatory proteins, luxR family
VAVLLASRYTNRQIAERLVIGERIVEAHVGNVLAKLGLESRRSRAYCCRCCWSSSRLANDGTILGGHTNGRVFNLVAYGTTAILIVLTAALLLASALGSGG